MTAMIHKYVVSYRSVPDEEFSGYMRADWRIGECPIETSETGIGFQDSGYTVAQADHWYLTGARLACKDPEVDPKDQDIQLMLCYQLVWKEDKPYTMPNVDDGLLTMTECRTEIEKARELNDGEAIHAWSILTTDGELFEKGRIKNKRAVQ